MEYDFKEIQDNHKRYTQGECHIFAAALYAQFGYQIQADVIVSKSDHYRQYVEDIRSQFDFKSIPEDDEDQFFQLYNKFEESIHWPTKLEEECIGCIQHVYGVNGPFHIDISGVHDYSKYDVMAGNHGKDEFFRIPLSLEEVYALADNPSSGLVDFGNDEMDEAQMIIYRNWNYFKDETPKELRHQLRQLDRVVKTSKLVKLLSDLKLEAKCH